MGFIKSLFVLVLLAAAAIGFFVFVPYGPTHETFVDIPTGTGTQGIAARLEHSGIIRSRYAFDALRIRRGGVLHAGEYRFDHPAPLTEVYDRIDRGDVYTRAVTIPEGYNLYDLSEAVAAAGLGSAADFLAATHRDTQLIADWSPQAASLEGYLFPDTYRFSRHATADQMVAVMVHRFRQQADSLAIPAEQRNASLITLASLVEKEVRVDSERPLVAGVFQNRIARNMPLATDPTVIYAALLDGRWQGPGPKTTIFRSDLDAASPYNTYKHTGLPPGPICNPGLAALKAALHPARTDYLYFVADAAGHSRFSATLEQHNANVQAYRKAQNQGVRTPF
ncbi:endolytic transglycosylase MltG [Granulicella sp. WH15]|uniref:endolytic transglycosylase MltG n=1 Tax=Granulicella sp. WH15 TaxID=2602070 RepID=UPI001367512F|nr:endolytic transglycosylase MltG [Granulicella sp. WH15]QHN05187.1 endolytic transglycosylase MltG [Granulicella sp. WH15]